MLLKDKYLWVNKINVTSRVQRESIPNYDVFCVNMLRPIEDLLQFVQTNNFTSTTLKTNKLDMFVNFKSLPISMFDILFRMWEILGSVSRRKGNLVNSLHPETPRVKFGKFV